MEADQLQKIAGMDFGSNSLRLAIAKLDPIGGIEIIHRQRTPLRLANDAFNRMEFSDETIDSVAAVAGEFALAMDKYQVSRYLAAGTEAFRKSKNTNRLIDRVHSMTGLQVEILSVVDEATLVSKAVELSNPHMPGVSLIIDLGGGSLEIIAPSIDSQDTDTQFESHPLGLAARFEKFLKIRGDSNETRRELAERAGEIGKKLESELLESCVGESVVVFVGGQAAMLDHLAVEWNIWSEEESGTVGISPEDLGLLLARAISEDPETLIDLGVPHDRAPMIAGAAALYHSIAVRINAGRLRLPRIGLMEGLLHAVPARGLPWPV